MSRPGDEATNPLDSSVPTQAYLVLSFIDCRLQNLSATTIDSPNVGLYTDRGAKLYYSTYCTRILTNANNSIWDKLHCKKCLYNLPPFFNFLLFPSSFNFFSIRLSLVFPFVCSFVTCFCHSVAAIFKAHLQVKLLVK